MINKELRKKIIEKACNCKLGHVGPALSCVDFIEFLYREIMQEKDIFILSKGHASMALYAVLEKYGKRPEWAVHPELNEKEGIHATTGSLGHGLPIAIGRALAKKLKGEPGKVYVLLGDCEMAEGSVWEALSAAKALNVDNLMFFVDWNKYGAAYPVEDTVNITGDNLKAKIEAFGFKTLVINGHEESELAKIKSLNGGFNAVILDTVKGKGVSFLEQSHAHGYHFCFNPDKYEEVMRDLS